MKRFSFKKNTVEKHLEDLRQVYCELDVTKALTTLRKAVKALNDKASTETLIEALTNVSIEDEYVYAVPCFCKVRYTVKTDKSQFKFIRYYIAYGATEADVSAYLEYMVELQIQELDECVSRHCKVQYDIEYIVACIK